MKYGEIPSGHVIIPWLSDQAFLKAYSEMSGRTLLHIGKCYMLYSLVKHVGSLSGLVAECGVYRGGSAYLIARAIETRKEARTLCLFDTFAGIPPGDATKDNRYIAGGEFADAKIEDVQRFMSPFQNIQLRKGLIPETFAGLERCVFSFVHIDLDIYRPILDSLNFFYHRMCPAGVIVLDDYGSEECRGAYLAVEEFCASIGTNPIVLPTGQVMLIKV